MHLNHECRSELACLRQGQLPWLRPAIMCRDSRSLYAPPASNRANQRGLREKSSLTFHRPINQYGSRAK